MNKQLAHTKIFSRLRSRQRARLMGAAAVFACLGVLALGAALLSSADLLARTYATDESTATTQTGSNYVTLTAPDVAMSVSPEGGAATSSTKSSVAVTTNSTAGVGLYLSMSGSSANLYLNGDTSASARIAAASSATSLDGMTANTWGYSLDGETYQGVPVAGSATQIAEISDTSSTVDVYYGLKADTSLTAGSYRGSLTYSAVVSGGVEATATLTSINGVSGATAMSGGQENTLLVTTNLKTNAKGTPRVYYRSESPAGYQACSSVSVGNDASGYLTITCKITPTTSSNNVTLYIVPQGSSEDPFCTDGTYPADSSQCEVGDWKWGSFTITGLSISAPSFMSLTYMQDMSPAACEAASIGDTKQLTDSRDKKKYWVAKLADGNCWMTQNLDLDLNGRTLKPTDSDVSDPNGWTYNGSWYNSAAEGSTSYSAIQGWDLGEYVKTSPTATTSCTSYSDLSECTSQFTSVAGKTAYTTDVNGGKLPAENVAVSGNNYDAHYLVGNYYSWPAATAGSGNEVSSSGDATDSICPANWRLPLSGGSNTENGSFYYLLNQYGLTSSPTSGNNNIATSPLYFVRSGYAYPNNSRLGSAGRNGYYWSGRARSSSYAYYLNVSSSSVYPSNGSGRYLGSSVRCVAGWE